MGFLESFEAKVTQVWSKLDDLGKVVLDKANLKNELQGVFKEVNETKNSAEKINELQLPEVYKNVASFLIQNQRAFNASNNIPEFLQTLLDIKADKLLADIDPNAIIESTGGRADDANIVIATVQNIVRLKANYTPQDNKFNLPYRYSAQWVMVKQADGNYLPLAQNNINVPQNTTYKNFINILSAHINGLPGGYTANEVIVPVPTIDAKQEAAKLVATQNPQTPSSNAPTTLQDLPQAA